MHIEVNRDLDKFKESVILGLSARQLIYSIIALALGSGIVLLVYPYVGLTIAAYIAVPAVAPIPKDLTTKMLQKKYLGVENDIIKQQRVRNKNNDFASDISYLKRVEKKLNNR